MKLTDAQWAKVKSCLPERKKPWLKRKRGGRPPTDDRKCFEGILWILWTGAQWAALPKEYGSKSAVHRRLVKWVEDGTLEKLWRIFLAELEDAEQLRWDECFMDGTFASAKKGAPKSAKPSAAREQIVSS
ncbi:MAG: transposase [Candidatus Omnitrophica bacterium]|nr:transposase [Candidatus Omnitrophota bacterium]